MIKYIISILSVFIISTISFADMYLVSDPCLNASFFKIRLLNDTSTAEDDKVFVVDAQEDTSLRINLVNFPAGENYIMVRAGNVFDESIEVPFEFSKDSPGLPSGITLVNIDGDAYLICEPQEGIYFYRVLINDNEFVVDANEDGSLQYFVGDLEDGIYSVEIYALNEWGDSNSVPFEFNKSLPGVPKNLKLLQE